MAMFQIGTDLVEIKRIKSALLRPTFLTKFYGAQEQAELAAKGTPPQSVAGAFAGKEAFSKAIGTGIIGFSLREVEILHYGSGKPYLLLSGAARELAKEFEFDISISHTDQYAMATVIAYERTKNENTKCQRNVQGGGTGIC